MSVYYPDDPDYSRGFYNSNNPELWKVMRKNTELRGQLRRMIADQFEIIENGVADLGSMEDNIRAEASATPSAGTPAFASTSTSNTGSVIPSTVSTLGSMAKGALGSVANGLYKVGAWAVQDPPSQNDIPAVVEYDRNLQREANRAIIALAQQGRPVPPTLNPQPAPAQPTPVPAPVQPAPAPAQPAPSSGSSSSSNVKLQVDKGIMNPVDFANAVQELQYAYQIPNGRANAMTLDLTVNVDSTTKKVISLTSPIMIGRVPIEIKGRYAITPQGRLLLSKPNTIILIADSGKEIMRLLKLKVIDVMSVRTVAKFYHEIGVLSPVPKISESMKLKSDKKSVFMNILSIDPTFYDQNELKGAGIAEPRMKYAIKIADNYDDLADRLAVLVGSQRSGNQSKELKNEGLAIIDKLRVAKQITKEQYQQLYKLFV